MAAGTDVDPLVVLAWVLLFGVPVAAAALAARRYQGPADSAAPTKTKIAQGVVAGVLANLSGALVVTELGTGTIALMLHATWLRTLFDHGHHLNAVVVYSHELDASTQRPDVPGHVPRLPVHRDVLERDGRGERVGERVGDRPGRPAARRRARSARSGAWRAGQRPAGGGRFWRGEADAQPVPRPGPR